MNGTMRTDTPAPVNLALVSHTNVGKTTLARTLLRRDVGEVRDQAHVTELAEAQRLIETPQGDVLLLWDTPGFGDSARLLKRLRASANPLGWLLTQVWDRFVDRPFYSSQQAVRAARDSADVILYLVNAAEDPAAAGYVEVEMQILDWLDKPVLLLLNQVGPPRAPAAEAAEEAAWRSHLAAFPCVRGALTLDAFARCWVQEDALLGAASQVIAADKQAAMQRLRAAWRQRNMENFRAAAQVLATQLAAAACDRETAPPATLKDRTRRWLTGLVSDRNIDDPALEQAMRALAKRLHEAVRNATDALLRLHGLSGQATDEILARVATQFTVNQPVDVARSGVIGGMASGALSGLAADLATGGLSFGAGALIGGVLGALGVGGAARAYNLARGTELGRVGWSAAFLLEHARAALLRYLAVAHFGRGRGDWVAGEHPAHWAPLADTIVARRRDALEAIWTRAAAGAPAAVLSEAVQPLIETMMREAIETLYPESGALFIVPAPHDAVQGEPIGAASHQSLR